MGGGRGGGVEQAGDAHLRGFEPCLHPQLDRLSRIRQQDRKELGHLRRQTDNKNELLRARQRAHPQGTSAPADLGAENLDAGPGKN